MCIRDRRYNLTDARYVENKLGLEDEKAYVLEYLKPITLDAPILKDDDWAIYTEHPIDEIYAVRFIAWEEIFLSGISTVSYTHLRAHETKANLLCRLLLE